MLESLLTNYGYAFLITGTFLEGETVIMLGSVAAHLGYLSLGWVIACGFCGTLCSDQLYFYLGRRHGQALLARHPSWQARTRHVFCQLERHQNLLILGFRFLYGLRSVTPLAIGMSDVSYLRFIILNLIGAAIWAICIGLAGFYFGHTVETALGNIKHYEVGLLATVITFGVLIWLVNFYRRRRSDSTASENRPDPGR